MKVIFDLKAQICFPVLYKIFGTNLSILFFEREMFTFYSKKYVFGEFQKSSNNYLLELSCSWTWQYSLLC